jgi:hypothetical protein
MSDIQFDETNNLSSSSRQFERFQPASPSERGMLGFLMKKGIVENEDTGNYILIGIAILFLVLSFIVFKFL